MKRILLAAALLVFCLSAFACGRKKEIVFPDDGLLVQLQTTPVGMVEDFRCYTMHIDIYANGIVQIYADNFKQWYGEEACPTFTAKITISEVETIKQMIREEDIFSLNEDVGSRDEIEGSRKFLTIYTTDEAFTTGGLSPSNQSFLKVFDYIYESVAEALYSYSAAIEELQQAGLARYAKQGIYVTDDRNEMLLTKEQIIDIGKEEYAETETATATGAYQTSDEKQKYRVILFADEESALSLAERTANCAYHPQTFFVYLDDRYYCPIVINSMIEDGKIYLNESYEEEEADAIVDELKKALENK